DPGQRPSLYVVEPRRPLIFGLYQPFAIRHLKQAKSQFRKTMWLYQLIEKTGTTHGDNLLLSSLHHYYR
ncbi:MAG: hypothetical protein QGG79_02240, partial [Dehalococcoidales bacterium]|nr:hypothetical protein [Dehalococcoidales bacterium]